MKKKNVAIVCGGFTGEKEVSIKSAGTIMNEIDKNTFNAFLIVIDEKEWVLKFENNNYPINKNDFSTIINNNKIKFDLVYNTTHGTPGEDGKLQGYFDLINIKYAGVNSYLSALTFNKSHCNIVLNDLGFQTANQVLLHKNDIVNNKVIIDKLGLPLFIKPNGSGSSLGISKIYNAEDISTGLEKAFKESNEALIENFIEGIEVTCGVLNLNGKTTPLLPTEIVPEGDFFDYDAKYLGKSKEITPARISKKETENIQHLVSEIYKKLNFKGVIRVDFIIDKLKGPYIIEINTNPGMSPASIIPQQIKKCGYTVTEMISNILNEA
jgi:D-alanine-D-alanine ligase